MMDRLMTTNPISHQPCYAERYSFVNAGKDEQLIDAKSEMNVNNSDPYQFGGAADRFHGS